MTFIQRRINVDATSWLCIDGDTTLSQHCVPAGVSAVGSCLYYHYLQSVLSTDRLEENMEISNETENDEQNKNLKGCLWKQKHTQKNKTRRLSFFSSLFIYSYVVWKDAYAPPLTPYPSAPSTGFAAFHFQSNQNGLNDPKRKQVLAFSKS